MKRIERSARIARVCSRPNLRQSCPKVPSPASRRMLPHEAVWISVLLTLRYLLGWALPVPRGVMITDSWDAGGRPMRAASFSTSSATPAAAILNSGQIVLRRFDSAFRIVSDPADPTTIRSSSSSFTPSRRELSNRRDFAGMSLWWKLNFGSRAVTEDGTHAGRSVRSRSRTWSA